MKQEDFMAFDYTRDMLFEKYKNAEFWLDSTGIVLINGEEAKTITKEDGKRIGDGFSFEIVAHRVTKPRNPVFSREQLKTVLINGDDNYFNSLVIDYQGMPKLIKITNRTPSAIREYPVRFETFQKGEGYVGSSSDIDHIETTYLALLEAWTMHVLSGRSIYRDYFRCEQSEQELINEILIEINSLS